MNPLSDLDRLIILATQRHAGQTDKAGHPYILHPLAVMSRCRDEFERCLGVTHDLVEDTGISVAEVAMHVQAPALRDSLFVGLDAITRRDGDTYAQFIDRICEHPAVMPVKIHDIEHNLSRMGNLDPDQARRLRARYVPALQQLLAERQALKATR